MRQIIFVNEARVEIAPKEYRIEDYEKTSQDIGRKSKNDKLRTAIKTSRKIYDSDKVSLAPEGYWEAPTKIPEDVKDTVNKLENPSFESKKMQKVW